MLGPAINNATSPPDLRGFNPRAQARQALSATAFSGRGERRRGGETSVLRLDTDAVISDAPFGIRRSKKTNPLEGVSPKVRM